MIRITCYDYYSMIKAHVKEGPMTLDYLIREIKNNKGRITAQRKIILKLLVDHQDVLMTADHLLSICQEESNDINMATIYRNLELLDQLNLLYKINVDPTTSGFKLRCMEGHHHHMICNQCGKMIAIDYCPISPELMDLADQAGFMVTDHSLELYGLCH